MASDHHRFSEPERLAALERCRILYTSSEPVFDDIVSVAASAFDVSFAALSFLDGDSAWLKSSHGFEPGQLDRVTELCSHIDPSDKLLLVCSPLEDPELANHPMVTAYPEIRFMAASSLVTRNGYRVGALILLDVRARDFSDDEISCLHSFARFVMDLVELRLPLATEPGSPNALVAEESASLLEVSGDRVLFAIVDRVTHDLEVDYAFLGDPSTGRAIVSKMPDPPLDDSTQSYPHSAFEVYGNDGRLRFAGIQGYAAGNLAGSSGELLGVLVVMNPKPTFNATLALLLLASYSTLAAGELERMRAVVPDLAVEAAIDEGPVSALTAGLDRMSLDDDSDKDVTTRLSSWVIGSSPGMRQALERVQLAAVNSVASILILGETGTGKGLLARLIHRVSNSLGPFVAINCGALPRELIESELFGYERGAFTGAIARKIGLFEQADGGTIFLDEIAELPSDLQVKLLSVLQEREFRRIGATRQLRLNARVIAATNRNLADAIGDGRFRSDLFFRIATWTIELPPLRQRGEDVILLARHFVQSVETAKRKSIKSIATDAEVSLEEYHWPGNVRELMNVVENALILETGTTLSSASVRRAMAEEQSIFKAVTPSMPSGRQRMVRPRTKRVIVTDDEARLIRVALERNHYNKTWTARELGLTRGQLEYRLKKLEHTPPRQ